MVWGWGRSKDWMHTGSVMGTAVLRPFLRPGTSLYKSELSWVTFGKDFVLSLGSRGGSCNSET